MRKWGLRIVFLAVLSVLVLSSAWAWPSVFYGIKESPAQVQQPSAMLDINTTDTEEVPVHLLLPQNKLDGESKIAEESSKVPLEGILTEEDLREIENSLDVVSIAQNTMINEFDEIVAERDSLIDENNQLSEDLANQMGRNKWNMMLIPEAFYDIGSEEWGIGVSFGVGWNQLMLSAGIEKTICDDFFRTSDDMRIRFGAGIQL